MRCCGSRVVPFCNGLDPALDDIVSFVGTPLCVGIERERDTSDCTEDERLELGKASERRLSMGRCLVLTPCESAAL